MGNTKGIRNADIRSIADSYKIPIKLSDGDIDQCADRGKLDIFMGIFPERHHLFRVINQTFNNGDDWPSILNNGKPDFFGLAGRQFVAGTPEIEVRFARPSEIPMLTRNGRIGATATQPVLFMANKKFYLMGVGTATIEYFAYPRLLADPSIGYDQTDSMPLDKEPDIARSGFEFLLAMLVERQTSLDLTQKEIQHTEAVIKDVYEKKYRLLNREPGEDD
jgi:hypothetical protein